MPTYLLKHSDHRPAQTAIDTIVVHSMYAPNSPAQLSPRSAISLLDEHGVASHYLIDRIGSLWTIVPENLRAWHAGQSRMPFVDDQRTNVNDFSIGVELIAKPGQSFNAAQYAALRTLCLDLILRYPIGSIVGHDQIAPGRKTDPGPLFDWNQMRSLINKHTNMPRIIPA